MKNSTNSLPVLEKCYQKLLALVIIALFIGIFLLQNTYKSEIKPKLPIMKQCSTNNENVTLNTMKRMSLRSDKYWVLYNHVRAKKVFIGKESITYVTQGEFRYLENIITVLNLWRGPISMTIFSPGEGNIQICNKAEVIWF